MVFYQTPWGVRSQTHRLAKATADRFFVALREKNQQVAAADANQRAKDSVGGIRNVPMVIVRGERERRGAALEDREDTTFTLIREAGGSSYRRVLDAQLIAEYERNPGVYKSADPGQYIGQLLQYDRVSPNCSGGSLPWGWIGAPWRGHSSNPGRFRPSTSWSRAAPVGFRYFRASAPVSTAVRTQSFIADGECANIAGRFVLAHNRL
jgi:hypothetical protein